MSKCYFFHIFIFFATSTIAQSPLFKEVSMEIGVDYIYPGKGGQEVGAGVTVLDVNNDGWDDFFQAGGVFQSKLWLNKNGRFIDATSMYNLDFLDGYYVQSAIAGDVNNDGFEDLFICNYGIGERNGDGFAPALLLNAKGQRFEKAMKSDFKAMGNYSAGAFGDLNNDGQLDLYLANYVEVMNEKRANKEAKAEFDPTCYPNRLYLSQRGKHFEETVLQSELLDEGCGLSVSFTDFDNDNDVDLMLLNDFGEWSKKGNLLFRNNFPDLSFTEVGREVGFYKEIYGMGIGPNDYDRDGDLDYYITNIGQNYLFENQNGKFEDQALNLKIDLSFTKDSLLSTSWSGLFFDYENDTDLDLYVANGNVYVSNPVTAVIDPNQFFLQNENGVFENVSKLSSTDDILSHRGAAFLDFDHDGDLDLISSLVNMSWAEFGGLDQKIKVFRNESEAKNNWIGLKLVGEEGVNKSCLGCSVTLVQDQFKMIKEVDGGSGHGSQSSRIVYFGLGTNTEAKELIIKWLGKESTSLTNLKAGSVYLVGSKGVIGKVY